MNLRLCSLENLWRVTFMHSSFYYLRHAYNITIICLLLFNPLLSRNQRRGTVAERVPMLDAWLLAKSFSLCIVWDQCEPSHKTSTVFSLQEMSPDSGQSCPQLAFLYLTPWVFNNPLLTQEGQHKWKQTGENNNNDNKKSLKHIQ